MLPIKAQATIIESRFGYALNKAAIGCRILAGRSPALASRSKRRLSGSQRRSGMIIISGISASA